MSSGRIENNGKSITFEINSQSVVGRLNLFHIDGDENDEPRIVMQMKAEAAHYPSTLQSTTMVMIPKSKTMILAHFFRQMADKMDEWYAEEMKGTNLDRTK